MYNRVLTDADRDNFQLVMAQMRKLCPDMYMRKIPQSMVQFAFAYHTSKMLSGNDRSKTILAAGSFEDIATACLEQEGFSVKGIDPVINLDLHTFVTRYPYAKFDMVVSASVLEHTEDDEEFVADSCDLLHSGGYGIFTMDFKDGWKQGERVPTTSRRFYTTHDLTVRLHSILDRHDCVLLDTPDYTAVDHFNWEGIQYSFACWVFQKKGNNI